MPGEKRKPARPTPDTVVSSVPHGPWAPGLDLGHVVLDGPRVEQRQLPHAPEHVSGPRVSGVFDRRDQPPVQYVADLGGDLLFGERRKEGERLESPGLAVHVAGSMRSRVSTASNPSKRTSPHSSMADRSSGECPAARRRMSGPSAARSRPSPLALITASSATLLAVAPAAFPHGWPSVPPPNWSTASSPKIATNSGMCQTWIPPEATGNIPAREAQGWSK